MSSLYNAIITDAIKRQFMGNPSGKFLTAITRDTVIYIFTLIATLNSHMQAYSLLVSRPYRPKELYCATNAVKISIKSANVCVKLYTTFKDGLDGRVGAYTLRIILITNQLGFITL